MFARFFMLLAIAVPLHVALLAHPVTAVTITWAPVGNPGNAPDTVIMRDGTTGYGSVGYNYNIGTNLITYSQYAEFLNAKDPTGADALDLYSGVASGVNYGINFNPGNANGNKYTLISGAENHPVVGQTWFSTLRFVNWLDNGQGNGDTETGAYTLLGGTPTPSNFASITRTPGATIFLPSEDEWYKAAYYNPATNSYFNYATSSNTPPTASLPTALPNHANIAPAFKGYTDVGAYTGTTSPYGAFDMVGNGFSFTETYFPNQNKLLSRAVVRGGVGTNQLLSSYRISVPTSELVDPVTFGFRVASVPEPSTAALAVFGCGLLWTLRKRLTNR